MKKSVAIYEKSLESINGLVDIDQLNLKWVPYTKEGKYRIDGSLRDPEDVALDYLWLSPLISAEKFLPEAFQMALRTKFLISFTHSNDKDNNKLSGFGKTHRFENYHKAPGLSSDSGQ